MMMMHPSAPSEFGMRPSVVGLGWGTPDGPGPADVLGRLLITGDVCLCTLLIRSRRVCEVA